MRHSNRLYLLSRQEGLGRFQKVDSIADSRCEECSPLTLSSRQHPGDAEVQPALVCYNSDWGGYVFLLFQVFSPKPVHLKFSHFLGFSASERYAHAACSDLARSSDGLGSMQSSPGKVAFMNATSISLGLLIVLFTILLLHGMRKLKPQITEFRSQRMCPACGLITSRLKARCLECGVASVSKR